METENEHSNKNEEEPLKVSLAENNKEDQENFLDAVYQAEIKADVTTSDTGQELMDDLKDTSTPTPDIIFMEQHMSLDNGKDVLKEIKKDDDLKDIPTVIYTESANERDIDSAYKDGANLYVQKPIFFRNLVRILRNIFTLNWMQLFTRPHRANFLIHEGQINDQPPKKTEIIKSEELKKNIPMAAEGNSNQP